MNICYVGSGRLGLSLAVWDAHRGHHVVCVDINPKTVDAINAARSPIDEPRVQELLEEGRANNRLWARSSVYAATLPFDIVFILVPTPSKRDGSFDMKYVRQAGIAIGQALADKDDPRGTLVVCVSTVMPGDSDNLIGIIEAAGNVKCGDQFSFAYSPEFVRQGSIIHDYSHPDLLMIGSSDAAAAHRLQEFYLGVVENSPPVYHMSLVSAEIAKIGLNTAVVAKMAVANQLAWLCHFHPGADAQDVLAAIGADRRIGHKYFGAGTWPGGPCVPPGTGVQTEHGLCAIEDIRRSDRVLSHDGEYHKVTKVYERWYKGPLVKITPEGFPGTPLVVTPDHPIWSATGKVRLSEAMGYSPLGFAAADILRKGDLLALPRVNPPAISPPEICLTIKTNATGTRTRRAAVTPDLMYFFGWYISEGSTWRKEIKLSLHARELHRVSEIDQITRRYFGIKTTVKRYTEGGNGLCTRTTSRALAQYLRETFGGHAYTKRVPTQWLGLPDEHLIQLLRGIWYGDGSRSGNRFTWATVSPDLFNFMRLLLLKFGIAFTTKIYAPRVDRDGTHHRQSYFLTVANPPAIRQMSILLPDLTIDTYGRQGKKSVWCDSGMMFYHIRKVERLVYEGHVYNLEVKGANSYMLESAVVHNCFPRDNRALAAAGGRRGVSTPMASAAEEFHDLQASWLAEEVLHWPDDMGGNTVGLLGLTYKPGTAIIEESQALLLAKKLGPGIGVIAYDPDVAVGISVRTLGALVERSRIIVLMIPKPEFKALEGMDLSDRAVFDCWGFFDEGALNCARYVRLGKGVMGA